MTARERLVAALAGHDRRRLEPCVVALGHYDAANDEIEAARNDAYAELGLHPYELMSNDALVRALEKAK